MRVTLNKFILISFCPSAWVLLWTAVHIPVMINVLLLPVYCPPDLPIRLLPIAFINELYTHAMCGSGANLSVPE
jgi:hypothetical protein